VTSRRSFLKRAAGLAAAGGMPLLGSCTPDAPAARRDRSTGLGSGVPIEGGHDLPERQLAPLTRPLLRPWAADLVLLEAPSEELPVAYVSMERREVYVDREYRDRASWLLRAHISVSTALWRIPLADDPPRQPITPGDEMREFEEQPIRAWDPTRVPTIDDIRIVRGGPARRRIEFACIPLAGGGGGGAWLSGGPIDVVVSDGSSVDTVREDFGLVGTGVRHADRACAGPGEAVQLVSWARRQLVGASR